jgi:carbamoyl-phosphate synthase small subunit
LRELLPQGFLLLEDGTLFLGRLAGPKEPTVAEVVFTTNMTGYQEVFTDPSYDGQIVVMTAPQIGNSKPYVAGVVVRELSPTYSNWRATGGLPEWLAAAGVPVLTEVDTRRLTKHLRSAGSMKGVIGFGTAPTKEALAVLDACPSMEGLDLATVVSTEVPYAWGSAQAPYHVVAVDYGIKRNILRLFDDHDVRVTVVPSTSTSAEILAHKPDGVFLSNGPGDPAAIAYAPGIIRELSEQRMPIFGICLGHQLVGLSFGGHTVKMPYGHRGGNHPVKDLDTGKVLITAQNHGFAVAGTVDGVEGAPDLEVTHLNLNDGSLEGLRHKTLPIFAVQYHPEAAPGPHDAVPLFDQFVTALKARRSETSQPLD